MIRIGNPPYLECSSHGDKRFSAFWARPESLRGQSIEEAYQAMKIFVDGSTGLPWREAKGRQAVNQEQCAAQYKEWFRQWINEQHLLPILQKASGLSDKFGQPGRVCQALVLWELRNEPGSLR
jgi:hypothetical protein